MSDIGFIGSKNLIGIFKLLGVSVFPAENAQEAKTHIGHIIEEGKLKVVFVLESLASSLKDELMKVEEIESITMVPLPDHVSEVSLIDDKLKRLSKEAIGMEV